MQLLQELEHRVDQDNFVSALEDYRRQRVEAETSGEPAAGQEVLHPDWWEADQILIPGKHGTPRSWTNFTTTYDERHIIFRIFLSYSMTVLVLQFQRSLESTSLSSTAMPLMLWQHLLPRTSLHCLKARRWIQSSFNML